MSTDCPYQHLSAEGVALHGAIDNDVDAADEALSDFSPSELRELIAACRRLEAWARGWLSDGAS